MRDEDKKIISAFASPLAIFFYLHKPIFREPLISYISATRLSLRVAYYLHNPILREPVVPFISDTRLRVALMKEDVYH